MKLQGKVVFVLATVACLASYTQAVFGDGSLNARHQEKGHSLSKRSVFELFRLVPWIRNQFSRSAPETNATTEAPKSSPIQVHTASGIKNDLARMLTLTRQRRAPIREPLARSRRSIQELRSVETFLKAEQNKLTDALRTLPGGLFANHHLHHHHPVHSGGPLIGLHNLLLPFGLQPGQNTVLFLHHNPQTTSKPRNDTNPATTARPEPNPPASTVVPGVVVVGPTGPVVGSPGPVVGSTGPVVGSTGPVVGATGPVVGGAVAGPPVVVVIQQPAGNQAPATPNVSTTEGSASPTEQTTDTTTSGSGGIEPRGVTPASTTVGSSTSESSTLVSTSLPDSSSASIGTSDASVVSTTQASSVSPRSAGGASSTASPSNDRTTSGQQQSTTEGGSTIEGSGSTSQGVQENLREDTMYRFLSDDS